MNVAKPDADFIKKSAGWQDNNDNHIVDDLDIVTYSFTVTNTGNVPITAVTISDSHATIQGELAKPIEPGESDETSFTGYHQITQEEIDAGMVSNTAELTATTPSGVFSRKSRPEAGEEGEPTVTELPRKARIAVQMSGEPEYDESNDGFRSLSRESGGSGEELYPGDRIRYTISVFNIGNVSLQNVTVTGRKASEAPLATAATADATRPIVEVQGEPIPNLPVGASDEQTFTAIHVLTQEDLDTGKVIAQVEAVGLPVGAGEQGAVSDISDDPDEILNVDHNNDGLPDDPVQTPLQARDHLWPEKSVEHLDEDGDGFFDPGEKLIYTVAVENRGNVTAKDVRPIDEGPRFNGMPGEGPMTAFEPESVPSLPSKGKQTFVATYTMTRTDVVRALGVKDGIRNEANTQGVSARGGSGISGSDLAVSQASIPGFEVTKTADLAQVRRGERVPYTITVTPTAAQNGGAPVTLIDIMPPGFVYLEGTASIDGKQVNPEVHGRQLVFKDVRYSPDTDVVVHLSLVVSGAASPGEYVNRAKVVQTDGSEVSTVAEAKVEVVKEPVFDCGDIIGKVFDDENRNGRQDADEDGLPGARVATVDGLLVTTDEHGRFHIACADLPEARTGSNFIMKLDPRTLPTGYRVTSENPRTVRLTAGKASRINFAAVLGRIVRLDINDAAFQPGTMELKPAWRNRLLQLIDFLETEESVLRLAYIDAGSEDRRLAAKRTRQLRRAIAQLWKQKPGRYRLEIETRVETQKESQAHTWQ